MTSKASETAERILKCLRRSQATMSTTEIQSAIGETGFRARSMMWAALKKLEREGKIQKTRAIDTTRGCKTPQAYWGLK